MRLTHWPLTALLIALLAPTLNAQTPAGSSYIGKQPATLKFAREIQRQEAMDLEFSVLKGPIDLFLSSLPGYLVDAETTPGASITFRHRSVPAWMDFALFRAQDFPLELSVADAEKHLRAVEEGVKTTHTVEILNISDPTQRAYERYFGQKPFNVVYRLVHLVPEGSTEPPGPAFVYHECWLALENYVLVLTLKAEEERYRGLFNQARRIWRDGSYQN